MIFPSRPIIGLDVESYQNFFFIGIKRFADGKRLGFEWSDRSTIDFGRLYDILMANTIVTFNGNQYDLPILTLAAKNKMGPRELHRLTAELVGPMAPMHWQIEKQYGIKIPKFDHIDLMEPNPSIRKSLKELGGRLHSKRIMDLPYPPDKRLTYEEMNVASFYCHNDIDTTEDIWKAMAEPMALRVELSKQYNMDLRSKSDAQIGEAIVRYKIEKATRGRVYKGDLSLAPFKYEVPDFIWFKTKQLNDILDNLRSSEFRIAGNGKVETPAWLKGKQVQIGYSTYSLGIGGLHSTEAHRAIHADTDHSLIDFDVASQYPMIMLKLGLYPKATGQAFQAAYRDIVETRLAAKAAGRTVEAEGGKIAANGVYGKGGSIHSFLYAPHMMVSTTLTGQLSQLMFIEQAEGAGIACVSANTDGVVVLCPRKLEPRLFEIVKQWETALGFKTEYARYKSMYNSSVNTYMAIKEDGKVKRKGDIGNPWKENDLRTMMSKNPKMTVCSDAVLEYIQSGRSMEETIRANKDPRAFITVVKVKGGGQWQGQPLGRVVRYCWAVNGAPIKYISSGNKVANTAGSMPLMELPDTLPSNIDYTRYIAEAEDLAYDLGILTGGKLV